LGRTFSIAVIGIDQLKQYANTHGKPVGEQILKLMAPKIVASCEDGKVFRTSGEELTVIFNGLSTTETLVALEALRKMVNATHLLLRGQDFVWEDQRGTKKAGSRDQDLPITLSIGVAEKVTDAATLSLVIKSAYRALYEAKGAGGNVVKRGLVVPEPVRRSYGQSRRMAESGT
jgi:diguanylate cyclase (GGDEF)-like protein